MLASTLLSCVILENLPFVFRGPKGVWTLQAKGEKPDISTDFNEATPTPTHMAITKLVELGRVKYVVSQNIDGLHLRSNLQRKYLSELHGNMFTEQCNACNRFVSILLLTV